MKIHTTIFFALILSISTLFAQTNYYEVLHISRDSDGETVNYAYHEAMQKAKTEAEIKKIREAFETLKDRLKRRRYDEKLKKEEDLEAEFELL